MNKLSPSILSADFKNLGEELRTIADAGAEYVHIDVMDGLFVPSITFGMPVIRSIRSVTDKVFDVHLMVQNPERYIEEFAACGADILTIHAEACTHLDSALEKIRSCGMKAGLALCPSTPLSVLDYLWNKVDMILIMTVNPGFGGQKYIPEMTEKIAQLRRKIEEKKLPIDLEVDGGVNDSTIHTVLEAGANILVAGSAVFGGDTGENVKRYVDIMKRYEK